VPFLCTFSLLPNSNSISCSLLIFGLCVAGLLFASFWLESCQCLCWSLPWMANDYFFWWTTAGVVVSPLFSHPNTISKHRNLSNSSQNTLQQAHSDVVYWWFTMDAVMEAKEMGWDDTQQCPMSQDGINLNLWTLNGAYLPHPHQNWF